MEVESPRFFSPLCWQVYLERDGLTVSADTEQGLLRGLPASVLEQHADKKPRQEQC